MSGNKAKAPATEASSPANQEMSATYARSADKVSPLEKVSETKKLAPEPYKHVSFEEFSKQWDEMREERSKIPREQREAESVWSKSRFIYLMFYILTESRGYSCCGLRR
jgi:hypothetical protein